MKSELLPYGAAAALVRVLDRFRRDDGIGRGISYLSDHVGWLNSPHVSHQKWVPRMTA